MAQPASIQAQPQLWFGTLSLMLSTGTSHGLRGLTAVLTAGATGFLLNFPLGWFTGVHQTSYQIALAIFMLIQVGFTVEFFIGIALPDRNGKYPVPPYPNPIGRGILAGAIWGALNTLLLALSTLLGKLQFIDAALSAILSGYAAFAVWGIMGFIVIGIPPMLGFWAAKPRIPYHGQASSSLPIAKTTDPKITTHNS
jgi:hypothetical protein